jgi:hypothetical protein
MKKRLTRRASEMIEKSLCYFPELKDKCITVGYTRKHLGSATLVYSANKDLRLIMRLKVRKLTYQTIGHELTHLVQGLFRDDRNSRSSAVPGKIPAGEKQCDIWTLARHELFCDDPPTYLRLPRAMREAWMYYANDVRKLCVAAIEKRNVFRLYIRWLEAEIRKLAQTPRRKESAPRQLTLPFTT